MEANVLRISVIERHLDIGEFIDANVDELMINLLCDRDGAFAETQTNPALADIHDFSPRVALGRDSEKTNASNLSQF